MEQFGNIVDDRSIAFGGSQALQTLDGFILPFRFQNGLPYLPVRPFSNHEWEMLPHIVLISDVNWDPSFADQDVSLPTPDPMLAALPMPVVVNTTCHLDTSPINELDPVITINRHRILSMLISLPLTMVHLRPSSSVVLNLISVTFMVSTQMEILPLSLWTTFVSVVLWICSSLTVPKLRFLKK